MGLTKGLGGWFRKACRIPSVTLANSASLLGDQGCSAQSVNFLEMDLFKSELSIVSQMPSSSLKKRVMFCKNETEWLLTETSFRVVATVGESWVVLECFSSVSCRGLFRDKIFFQSDLLELVAVVVELTDLLELVGVAMTVVVVTWWYGFSVVTGSTNCNCSKACKSGINV